MAEKLIPKEEMNILKPASEVKAIANKAVDLQDESAAAYIINDAANTGCHIAVWRHPMTDTLRATLEGKGYTVTQRAVGAGTTNEWAITGF